MLSLREPALSLSLAVSVSVQGLLLMLLSRSLTRCCGVVDGEGPSRISLAYMHMCACAGVHTITAGECVKVVPSNIQTYRHTHTHSHMPGSGQEVW